MLRFRGYIESHPTKDNSRTYNAQRIPTVDMVEDIISPMTADTILQILHGQGYYWGYECKTHADNRIPFYPIIETPVQEMENKQLLKAIKLVAKYQKVSLKEAKLLLRIEEE